MGEVLTDTVRRLKVRSVPEQWSIWPKHDKSIF